MRFRIDMNKIRKSLLLLLTAMTAVGAQALDIKPATHADTI